MKKRTSITIFTILLTAMLFMFWNGESKRVTVYAKTSKTSAAKSKETSNKTSNKISNVNSESLVEKIARLASESATAEWEKLFCVVDVNDDKYPYFLEWRYGKKSGKDNEYNEFTKGLDWAMVFDADYYASTFPVLAHLLHNDEEQLFEHFRTVGIHEGRQGSKSFNVAAYMDVCSKELKDAFGDHYAAYYLYWLEKGHKETKASKVVSASKPKQMTAVLTAIQERELEQINEERKRLGRKPLVFDSELAAFAEYRAWTDAKYGYEAHDWIKDKANKKEANSIMDMLNTDMFSENTVKKKGSGSYTNWYACYKDSKKHYEAMVNAEYRYIGISNAYYNADDNRTVQFDMFAEKLSTALN